MKGEKKKDNLTDLVDSIVSEDTNGNESNNGQVTTPSGDTVTLGYKVLAKRLLDAMLRKKKAENIVRTKKENRPKS